MFFQILFLILYTHFNVQSAAQTKFVNFDAASMIVGDSQNLRFGEKIVNVGDVNDDGKDDFLVSSPNASPNFKNQAGEVYLIFGNSFPWDFTDPFNISILTGGSGAIIPGWNDGDQLGYSIGGGGDATGDGINDFLICTPYFDEGTTDTGACWLVLGRPAWTDIIDLTVDSDVIYLKCPQSANSHCGWSSTIVKDINIDGRDDILIGAPESSPLGRNQAGVAYLLFGSSTFSSTTPLPPDLDEGFTLQGRQTTDSCGTSVSSAGDVNGDGFNDFMVSSPSAQVGPKNSAGIVYVVFGRPTPYTNLWDMASFSDYDGFIIEGINANQKFGYSLSPGGNFNNDVFSEFLIGSPFYKSTTGFNTVGATYLFYGTPQPKIGNEFPFPLSSFSSSIGLIFEGSQPLEYSSKVLASAGDVNGDGMDDILIGSPSYSGFSGISTGSSFLIYGFDSTAAGNGLPDPSLRYKFPQPLSDLDPLVGVQIIGQNPFSYSGNAVAGSDFTGDGRPDLIISSYKNNPGNLSNAGSVHIFPSTCSSGQQTSIPTPSNIVCTDCPIGSFSTQFSATCTQCSPGHFQDTPKSDRCDICPRGQFQNQPGASECIDCYTPGSVCPPGSILPAAAYGYSLVPGTINVFGPCYPPEACPGGLTPKCATGYTPPDNFCSECTPQGYYRANGYCNECPDTGLLLFFVITILYVFIILSLIPFSANGHRLGLTSIWFSYLQLISLFGYFSINAHPLWNFSFTVLSASLFNVELVAPECASENVNFYSLWLVQIFLPLISIGILALAYFWTIGSKHVYIQYFNPNQLPNDGDGDIITPPSKPEAVLMYPKYYWNLIGSRIRYESDKQLRQYFTGAGMFVLALLYTIVTKSSLTMVDCRPHYGDVEVLEAYPSLECYTDEWYFYAVFSYLVLIFFSLGFPGLIIFLVLRNSKLINSPDMRLFFGCFVDLYKEKYPFWGAISLWRKFAFLWFTIMLTKYILTSLILVIIILLVSLVAQYRFAPYWTNWLNRFELMTLFSSLIIVILALVQGIDSISPSPSLSDNSKFFIALLNIVVILVSICIGVFCGIKHYQEYRERMDNFIRSNAGGIQLTTFVSKV